MRAVYMRILPSLDGEREGRGSKGGDGGERAALRVVVEMPSRSAWRDGGGLRKGGTGEKGERGR